MFKMKNEFIMSKRNPLKNNQIQNKTFISVPIMILR